MPSTQDTAEVVICGCGPTGALLSVLLAQLKVRSICLDKEPGIVTDPRGIALDEDGIRALQTVGVLNDVYTKIGQSMGVFNFVGGVHADLHAAPFMQMDYGTSEGGTGHVGFICHKQPALESSLRQRMASEEYSDLRTSCAVTAISEDDEGVAVTYQDATGSQRIVNAKFLVGADGKTGVTRKHYLEPKGVKMEQISATDYSETWVAMNLKLTLPTPTTHPDFPLWRQGYTPEDVFDAFFPRNFRFLCNHSRPAVCGRFGLPSDRLWRFEFVVKEGEDGTFMASPEMIRQVVYPYLRHPGHKYGLSADVAFPEDCIDVIRSRPFLFSARSCNSWSLGRVALCGDSAHVFPPFGGQGIASGFRDAMGLAWRLKVAAQRFPHAHEHLLSGWYQERKQQLERSLAATIENGQYVTEGNPIRIFLRNTYLAFVQMIPSWKRWLEQGARREGLCRYRYEPGVHFSGDLLGGGLFPQVYCYAASRVPHIQFSDDIVFSGEKSGVFQLVVLASSIDAVPDLLRDLSTLDVDALSSGFVRVAERTIVVQDSTADVSDNDDPLVVRVASAEEFARSPLCEGRPEPRYYDEGRLAKEMGGRPFAIVRPDRFTFAACSNTEELRRALLQIEPALSGEEESVPDA